MYWRPSQAAKVASGPDGAAAGAVADLAGSSLRAKQSMKKSLRLWMTRASWNQKKAEEETSLL